MDSAPAMGRNAAPFPPVPWAKPSTTPHSTTTSKAPPPRPGALLTTSPPGPPAGLKCSPPPGQSLSAGEVPARESSAALGAARSAPPAGPPPRRRWSAPAPAPSNRSTISSHQLQQHVQHRPQQRQGRQQGAEGPRRLHHGGQGALPASRQRLPPTCTTRAMPMVLYRGTNRSADTPLADPSSPGRPAAPSPRPPGPGPPPRRPPTASSSAVSGLPRFTTKASGAPPRTAPSPG